MIRLRANDGHEFDAYPQTRVRGGIVIAQEMYGVNDYGSMIPDLANLQARCPVICHIGDRDTSLPPARVAIFRAAQPSVPVYIYEGAPHGFDNENRTERYNAGAHKLARERTLAFLAKQVG